MICPNRNPKRGEKSLTTSLDDKKWLEWYSRLQNDKVQRSLGFLRPDEGTLGPEDKLQLMIDRGQGPEEPVTIDSVRRRMGLPPLDSKEET